MKKVLLFMLFVVLAGCGSTNAAEYEEDMQSLADDMLENATKTEGILDSYSLVWDHTIKSGGAIPVEEMATLTGIEKSAVRGYFEVNSMDNIPDDFSSNINSMNAYYGGTGELREIEKQSDEIKSRINELNNPPGNYEKAYDELLDMYTYSQEYIEMALNPDGSLQSFNEKKNRLSSDIASKYKRVEATMPTGN